MNLRDAFAYLSEHYQTLQESDGRILGVAFTPEDNEAEFYFVELSLDDDAKSDDNIDYFSVHLAGGKLSNSEGVGVEDFLGDENIDSLLSELPKFAEALNYQVYHLEDCVMDVESSIALKTVFPSLPDPDVIDLSDFKLEAISLIAKLNFK